MIIVVLGLSTLAIVFSLAAIKSQLCRIADALEKK